MRILFLAPRPPWPPRRGDQARTAGFATELARNHLVRVVALRPPGFQDCFWPPEVSGTEVSVGWPALALAAATHPGLPVQVGLHRHRGFERAIRQELENHHPDAVVVVLSRLGTALRHLNGLPILLDFVDSLGLNMRARARRQRLMAPVFRWEAKRLETWDTSLLQRVHHAAVVCARDRSELADGDERLARKISVLPFGLPVPAEFPRRPEAREIVLLSGNLGYFPTVDAALWFARNVWPLILLQRPQAEWWLAGARPVSAVRRLTALPGVRLIADPADLRPIREAAALAVAPLRSGSGTPIKVLEAMAAGIPVVATSSATAGLDGLPPSACATADDPARFAELVVDTLANRKNTQDQTETAWAWVQGRHSISAVTQRLETLLERMVTDHRPFDPSTRTPPDPCQSPPMAPE